MADALGAREQRIVELNRIEVEIALDLLEPLQRVAGGRLQAQHFKPSLFLVALESLLQCRFAVQIVGQSDCAVECEPGAGADRKMRGGGCVAHEHDIAVVPALADHPREIHPDRGATQMVGVRHQLVAAKVLGKHLLAHSDAFFLGHVLEAPIVPGLLRALHDHRRGVLVELIGVDPHPAMFGFFEDEGEGVVEFLVRAEPDEFALTHIHIRLEDVFVLLANERVDAVASDDEIVFLAVLFGRFELAFEPQVHAEFAGARLKDEKQLHAADTGKAVAAGNGAHAAMDDGDIVPVGECVFDFGRALRVVRA